MNSLNLEEAAKFLQIHRVTLLRKVAAGEIQGAKIGKRWVFLDADLAEYVRSKYRLRPFDDGRKELKQQCTPVKATIRTAGRSTSPSKAGQEYAIALGLPIESKHSGN